MLTLALVVGALAAADGQPRALILSGANNHDWRTTTPALERLLREPGGFVVTVCNDVPAMTPADLAGVDLVVGNFNTYGRKDTAPIWNEAMRQAFIAHIAGGRGFASVHAGGSVWYDWPGFFALAGGRWGKGTCHGRPHAATVTIADRDHPITSGLDAAWPHRDEFWQRTELAEGVRILATVVPDPAHGGSGAAEPMAWTTTCGQGRGFGLLLGHDAKTMEQPAFTALFVRGCRWAATGTVPPPR